MVIIVFLGYTQRNSVGVLSLMLRVLVLEQLSIFHQKYPQMLLGIQGLSLLLLISLHRLE